MKNFLAILAAILVLGIWGCSENSISFDIGTPPGPILEDAYSNFIGEHWCITPISDAAYWIDTCKTIDGNNVYYAKYDACKLIFKKIGDNLFNMKYERFYWDSCLALHENPIYGNFLYINKNYKCTNVYKNEDSIISSFRLYEIDSITNEINSNCYITIGIKDNNLPDGTYIWVQWIFNGKEYYPPVNFQKTFSGYRNFEDFLEYFDK